MTVAKTALLQDKYNDKYNDKKDCVKNVFRPMAYFNVIIGAGQLMQRARDIHGQRWDFCTTASLMRPLLPGSGEASSWKYPVGYNIYNSQGDFLNGPPLTMSLDCLDHS